jgi:23S rRNA (uracil1939-C5)-methyltransferase
MLCAMHETTLAVGDQISITIDDMAYGGAGVGRVDGLAVFVPHVCIGERVLVEVVQRAARFARARLVRVEAAADERIEPVCPYAGTCGGCCYQHVAYAAEAAWKQKQVRDLLERIGRFADPPVADMVQAPAALGYRNKLTLHGPGQPGYVGQDGVSRVPIEACAIADAALNEALAAWRRQHPRGLRKHEDLSLRLDADGRAWVAGAQGGQRITQRVGGRAYSVPLASFFQVNPAMTEALVAAVRQRVEAAACEVLVDAYAGVGLFGLACAAACQRLYLIESDQAAMRAARVNAEGVAGAAVQFVPERVESGLAGVLACVEPARTLVVLDPPRSGCGAAVLTTILERAPRRLIYISCAPDALARDLRRLVDGGYALGAVTPFDLFPRTAHMEVVAELEWAGAEAG